MTQRRPSAEVLPAELRQALAAAGIEGVRLIAVEQAWEAVCYFIDAQGGRRLVLKVARPCVPGVTMPIKAEAEALRVLRAALSPSGHVHAPAVIAIFPTQRAYLMERVPGQSMHRYLLRLQMPKGWTTTLATRLLEGLATYHAATGNPYGDFHPGNVLVEHALEPWLIDPVARDGGGSAAALAVGFSPAASDLGLWAYKAVSRVPRPAASTPWAVWRLLRLSRELVRLSGARFSPGAGPAFEAEVQRVAAMHLDLLAASRWPRDRMAAAAGRRLLRFVASAC